MNAAVLWGLGAGLEPAQRSLGLQPQTAHGFLSCPACLPARCPPAWITQAHPCDGRLSVSIAMVPSQVTKH